MVFLLTIFERLVEQPLFTIAAGGETCLPISKPGKVTDQLSKDWNNGAGKYSLIVYGKISYEDRLGNPRYECKFAALHINWELPRPSSIPDFWIRNDLKKSAVEFNSPKVQ